MNKITNTFLWAACSLAVVASMGCASKLEAPATASLAVSGAAVDNASSADGTQFAPVEMASAREKMVRANAAMNAKDYAAAMDLASQAQADAKLAQGKANTAKAQISANALQEDIRVLREELVRANAAKTQ